MDVDFNVKLNIKRNTAIFMSALMLFQNGGCFGAKAIKNDRSGADISFGQKIKCGFEVFKNKIVGNPKKSAKIGVGVGLGVLLLFLLGVVMHKNTSSDHEKRADNLALDDKDEVSSNEKRIAELTYEQNGGNNVCSMSSEQGKNSMPTPEKNAVSEDYSYFGGVRELFEGHYNIDDTSDVGTLTPKIFPTPRTPSPKPGEELKLNEELQIEISFSVSEEINKFCKKSKPYNTVQNERDPEQLKLLVEFLSKIENNCHKNENLTSLLEANATRCWQNSIGLSGSQRVIKNDVLDLFEKLAKNCQFENGVINRKKTKGTIDWDIFKTLLLRRIGFASSPSGPNTKILCLRQ